MAVFKPKTYRADAAEKPASSRLRKTIYLLPNMFTAANMVAGIWSITWGIKDSLTLSLSRAATTSPSCGRPG